MEGSLLVSLFEPVAPTQNNYGEPIPGPPIRHKVWAVRLDRGGGESLQADTQVGEWKTRFQVRQIGLERMAHSWTLKDDFDRDYDIEAVSEAPGARRLHWWLFCVSRGR